MRAVVLKEAGGPEKLVIEQVPDLSPGTGEVVVQIKAAALNHRDVWIRLGQYAGIKLPCILGSDGAGEVVACGAGVAPAILGREVVINPGLDWGQDERSHGPHFRILGMPDPGTYSEQVCVHVNNVHDKPGYLSFEEAAALPLAGLTAYRALVTRAKVQPGETVLVTGLGGGVATYAVQMAKALGAKVYVTSGSNPKLARAHELGADGGVNYKDDKWAKAAIDLTNGGADVIIDGAGGDTLAKSLEIIRPGGRIVGYGATLGPVSQFEVRRLFWKQISFLGSTMGSPREFAKMLTFYSDRKLKPTLDLVFPLDKASDAHRRMEEAGQFGKIVLAVA